MKRTKLKSTNLWTRLLTYPVALMPYYGYEPSRVKRHDSVRMFHERASGDKIRVMSNGRVLGYVPSSLTHVMHAAKARGARFRAFINQHFPAKGECWVAVDVVEPKAAKHMEF